MLGNPRSGSKVWKALDREIAKPGRIAAKYSRTGGFNLRVSWL
jgi:hypothetical protein